MLRHLSEPEFCDYLKCDHAMFFRFVTHCDENLKVQNINQFC